MSVIRVCAVVLVIIAGVGLSVIASARPLPQTLGNCGEIKKQFNPEGKPPVVFGKAEDIPGFRIRLMDSTTGVTLPFQQMAIAYTWAWWRYSADGPTGDWYPAGDRLECTTDSRGEIIVPPYRVGPLGWHALEKPNRRLPKFEEVVVSVYGYPAVWLPASQINRIRRKNFRPFLLKRDDGFVGMYHFEISPVIR